MDRTGIAARVRELLAIQHPQEIIELARRLNVSELSLRMTIDDLSPHPTIEVLSAVVAHYGADPAWVLTGVYDSGQHRRALEGTNATITEAVRELSAPRDTPSITLPAIRPRERSQSDPSGESTA
ncbi:MAG TPA: hypothetical protein VGM84_16315 [Steroidobacteraceae bacterium]|jgi:hypothetical protein